MDELKLEGYIDIKSIGKGGMGAVYSAIQESLHRKVAIKEILDTFIKNVEFHSRFKREALIMARLDHPNIARIYDLVKDKYIIMEFIDGESLYQLIKSKVRLSEIEAIDIISQAAKGLGAAHQSGILHRDIKPQNIMINKNNVVKILDFGIARAPDLSSTTTGSVMGTLAYMSPEQARGIKSDLLDGRTDIYSLGVTLYQAVTGNLPFEVDTDMDFVHKHKVEPPIPPSRFLGNIEPLLENAILKALEKLPDKRFQKAEEFADELIKIKATIIEKQTKQQDAVTVVKNNNVQIDKESKVVTEKKQTSSETLPLSDSDIKINDSLPPKPDINSDDSLYPVNPLPKPGENSSPNIPIKHPPILTFKLGILLVCAVIAAIFIIQSLVKSPGDNQKNTDLTIQTQDEQKKANDVLDIKKDEVKLIEPEITSPPPTETDEKKVVEENKQELTDDVKKISQPEQDSSENKNSESSSKPAVDVSEILNHINEVTMELIDKNVNEEEIFQKLSKEYEDAINNNPTLKTASGAGSFFEGYGDLYFNAAKVRESSEQIEFAKKAKENYQKAKSLYKDENLTKAESIDTKISLCDEILNK